MRNRSPADPLEEDGRLFRFLIVLRVGPDDIFEMTADQFWIIGDGHHHVDGGAGFGAQVKAVRNTTHPCGIGNGFITVLHFFAARQGRFDGDINAPWIVPLVLHHHGQILSDSQIDNVTGLNVLQRDVDEAQRNADPPSGGA